MSGGHRKCFFCWERAGNLPINSCRSFCCGLISVTCHVMWFDSVAGGSFKLELFLPSDYPMAPPKVKCDMKYST